MREYELEEEKKGKRNCRKDEEEKQKKIWDTWKSLHASRGERERKEE